MSGNIKGFSTAALHTKLDKIEYDVSNSIAPVITPAANYQIDADQKLSSDMNIKLYQRYGNVSRDGMEAVVAKMEGAKRSLAFSCGMSASNAVVEALLKSGDEIVACKVMYGGNYGMWSTEWTKFGVTTNFVTSPEPETVAAAVNEKTKLVWLETCTNPLVDVIDVQGVANAIKAKNPNVIFAVDNTQLSPFILRPLEFGADLVMHSATKYMSGHSDLLMGLISANDDNILNPLKHIQGTRGATSSPFDCFLMHRSLFTLEVRMMRHHETSLKLAKYLQKHPAVSKVLHPLLPGHPSRAIALKQNAGLHSGMITFFVKGGEKEATSLLGELKVIICAASLGSAHSLACYPPRLSHKFLSESERQQLGIDGGIVRLSVGLENAEDLMADLDQALTKATGLGPLSIEGH